ncbi:MAG: hypothetical protein IBX61_03090 [Thermoleophilia bacterium]|nr:hypothetical protein [Thermoleophilia bacterium]
MTTWEEKFVRFMSERWVFQGTDPHDYTPRTFLMGLGEDFISPLLKKHRHFGALYTGYLGGRLVGYMRVPPGTVILEGIMRALEFTRVDKVIGIGTCGALQPEIELGEIVIAESAEAGDGLSPHYGVEPGAMVAADGALTDSLGESLRGAGLKVHSGAVVTTGAAFRETDEMIDNWRRAGLLGVELETSCLLALARFTGVRAAVAHLVTDSPVRMATSDGVLRGKNRHDFVKGITDFMTSPTLA